MGRSIGDPLGFAQATLSGASSALNLLFGAQGDIWDIQESAYGHAGGSGNVVAGNEDLSNLVVFHVFQSRQDWGGSVSQVQDQGGRRKIPFAFPYRDGQTTDDLGRRAQAFEFGIVLHGPLYMRGLNRLIRELEDPRPGILIHPVRGRLDCVAESWTITHQSEQTQAVTLSVRFIEHNFDVTFEKKETPTTKSFLTEAVKFISTLNKIVTDIESTVIAAQSVINALKAATLAYQENYQSALVRLNATFNRSGSEDLPGLFPTNTDSRYTVGSAVSDPYEGIPVDELEASTASALAAQQAVDVVQKNRALMNALIAQLSAAGDGQGALEFYDQIKDLKAGAISMQNALEAGLKSNNARVKKYTVPREMSLREATFLNGLEVDRVIELELLNPDLLSVNLVAKDTILKVPSV